MASDRETIADVCIGVITGAVGVQGEVRIKPYTAKPEDVGAYGPIVLKGTNIEVVIKVSRLAKDGVVAKLEGVSDREAAQALKGTELYVSRAKLPGQEEDEYYHADLIGLTVEDLEGASLGTVKAVYDFGAGEMLEVKLNKGGVAVLPFTKDAIPQVMISEGRIVADPPEGVLPAEKPEKSQTRPRKSGKNKGQRGTKDV
jgi:16S rRNA processing protein RimM